jgi:hypothetical protein
MTNYDTLPDASKQALMNYAAQWLALKPELIGETKTDLELIDRLGSFARTLHEYTQQHENAEPHKQGSSVSSVPISY